MSVPAFDERYAGNPAENYERYFVPSIAAPLGDDLIAAAALQPGERVLDVACGTGLLARRAAERVGRSGSVAGSDIHPAMLAVARCRKGAKIQMPRGRAITSANRMAMTNGNSRKPSRWPTPRIAPASTTTSSKRAPT